MKIKPAYIILVAATAIFAGSFASANSKPPQIQPPIAEKPPSNKTTKAKEGRNPRTGETIQIKAAYGFGSWSVSKRSNRR